MILRTRVGAQALGYRLSGADEFDGLGFELGGIALTGFRIHPD